MNSWLAAPEGDLDLKENNIDVWLFHLNMSIPRIKHFYPLLSDDEKERSEKFHNHIHRKRFIASHGFMRSILSRYLGEPADQLIFNKGDNGKPFLELSESQPGIQFNLSHSHNMALLGVCQNNELGIDIEYMNRKNDWHGIIKRFFTEAEQKKIFSLPEDQQQKAFFTTWTRKEAHMKVTGLGLRLAPGQFTVSTPPDNARLIEYINDHEINSEQWSMSDIEMPELAKDYCGCLSYQGKINTISQYMAI